MSRPRGCLRCRSCGERRSGSARRRRPTRPPCCASWRRQMRAPVTRMTRMTGRLRSLPDAAGGSASVLAGSSRRIRCVCSLSLLFEQNLCLILSDVLFFRPGTVVALDHEVYLFLFREIQNGHRVSHKNNYSFLDGLIMLGSLMHSINCCASLSGRLKRATVHRIVAVNATP